MAVLVNHTDADIVMDTLPVIKLTEWYGVPGRDQVYAYARVCICRNALRVSMTVFDGEPPATQQAIAVLELGGRLFQLAFTPERRVSFVDCTDAVPVSLPAPPCLFSAGSDEQGWYWQALCTVSADALEQCGVPLPVPGDSFRAGFFLQDEAEEAFGSAFPINSSEKTACLGELAVIPY